VSGLGGHPIKTWQYTDEPEDLWGGRKVTFGEALLTRGRGLKKVASTPHLRKPSESPPSLPPLPGAKGRLFGNQTYIKAEATLDTAHQEQHTVSRRYRSTSRLRPENLGGDDKALPDAEVFWPRDLLSVSCPNTRIMTWGCQVLSTNGKLLPSQHNIFTHADDLLHDLSTHRDETKTVGRAIIFVAHSLGGLMVKEVSRRARPRPGAIPGQIAYRCPAASSFRRDGRAYHEGSRPIDSGGALRGLSAPRCSTREAQRCCCQHGGCCPPKRSERSRLAGSERCQ